MSNSISSDVIKLEAHNIAVGHIEESIQDLTQLIKDKHIEDDGLTSDRIDNEILSRNTEDQEFILSMEQKIISFKNQLALLDKFKHAEATTIVDPGSLVFVQDQVFYVSTSVESFDYKGHKVTCISGEAPIYKVMRGLSAGDKFECNGKNYTIEKIA